jgi:hypothetical protein
MAALLVVVEDEGSWRKRSQLAKASRIGRGREWCVPEEGTAG